MVENVPAINVYYVTQFWCWVIQLITVECSESSRESQYRLLSLLANDHHHK